jgi:hypothetical protein
MISKKYIKEMDFETIDDIYKYIIDSEINGAISQFKELIKKLGDKQFQDFILSIKNTELKNKVINVRFGV